MDSLQHLSAAERECLMYLEETIDSLDVDEDSGLSNDEPETSHQAAAIAVPCVCSELVAIFITS